MQNRVIEVLPKREFDFSSVGSGKELVVLDGLDSRDWIDVTLKVRVHSNAVTGVGNVLYVLVRSMAWTAEDPSRRFVAVQGTGGGGAAQINSTVPSPGEVDVPIGIVGATAVVLVGAIRSTAGTIKGMISASLSIKVK